MTRVLIVDDEPDIVAALSLLFRLEGFEVVHAENGEAAWELLQREAVDVLVTDRMMPRMDGLQLCRRIRDTERLRGLPIVMHSAGRDRPDGEGALFDGFIAKPYDFADLLALVVALAAGRASSD